MTGTDETTGRMYLIMDTDTDDHEDNDDDADDHEDNDDEDNDDDDNGDDGGGDDVCFADVSGAQLMTAAMMRMTAGTDETTGRMDLIVATSASSAPPSFAISPLLMK